MQQKKKVEIKRKIKRKKPGTGPSNYYFTQETQEAIIQYQSEQDEAVKIKLFNEKIMPAFTALVENLINVYGFKANHETKDDLRNECISFLYTVINKYDSTKSFRAFAYFNVVAKNWLTIRCKMSSKRSMMLVSLDTPEAWSERDMEVIESANIVDGFEYLFNQQITRNEIKFIINAIRSGIKNDEQLKVLEAADVIIDRFDELEYLNKRAVTLYLREITGLNSKQLSMALSGIKRKYKSYKSSMNNNEH